MDLHTVAEAAIRLVRQHPDCGKGVKITLEGQATPMEGDEDLVHRVVSNLVLNAVQAAVPRRTSWSARAGRRRMRSRCRGIENPVALRVTDDGPGIPEELQERLFEPFATGRVGGTGLGLAIVQRRASKRIAASCSWIPTRPGWWNDVHDLLPGSASERGGRIVARQTLHPFSSSTMSRGFWKPCASS